MESRCFLCNSRVEESTNVQRSQTLNVNCPICGYYSMFMAVPAMAAGETISDEDKILFSGYLQGTSTIENRVTIDRDALSKIPEIVERYKNMSVDEKIDLIIRYLAKNTETIGGHVKLEKKFARFFLKKKDELAVVLNWMKEMNLIKCLPGSFFDAVLNIEGWHRYEKLKEVNVNSKKAFVAMSFDEHLKDIFDKVIEPACDTCGFEAKRVDLIEHNEQITDKIIVEIKESRFVIADFTQQKHGVYFEAGFAQGLGLEVIRTCKEEEKGDLHFDIRQYNHILWADLEVFKEKLINRIKVTIK